MFSLKYADYRALFYFCTRILEFSLILVFESRNLDLFLSGVWTRMKRASDVTGCTRVPILLDITMVLSCIKVYSIAVCALMRYPKPIIHPVIRFQRVTAYWRMTVKTFMAFLT